ncbi:type II toxin-antitoxin system death-on-curing family toxin [Actinoplanes sp. NPDC051633]|uniref:type II toxin-antitoxin system death-on-curing family toxin n=1 Tax=Actinoplanes sp. NPDC051633 TaxID=3155670 RepID=UPI00344898AD
MIYLDVEDLLQIAGRTLGASPLVRDMGLLGASAARPQTNVFGYEPYKTLGAKAAALLVSLTMNHALQDGNKRLALAAAEVFIFINTDGALLEMTNDEKYHLVMGVARGELDVDDVAAKFWEAGIP